MAKVNNGLGVVVAEIHIFDDSNYEYTGRSMAFSSTVEIKDLAKKADSAWGEYHGFEVFGAYHDFWVC